LGVKVLQVREEKSLDGEKGKGGNVELFAETYNLLYSDQETASVIKYFSIKVNNIVSIVGDITIYAYNLF